jgi:thiol-disulfide isomerase/thioredoxin
MVTARREALQHAGLSSQVPAYLKLGLALALIVGVVWLLDAGRGGEVAGEATAITLAGGLGGVAPRIGEPAPDFALETLDGSTLALADLRGRPVIINLWASWCPPCRGELPDLETLAREYGDRGLVVLGVNLQEDRASVQRYADALGLTFTIALDRQGAVANRYNLNALPTSYFVDRAGTVRDVNIGPLTERGLRAKLGKVLE